MAKARGRLGPWADETGALLVFRVEEAEMDEIVAADPYYTAPGVTVVARREWKPLVGV